MVLNTRRNKHVRITWKHLCRSPGYSSSNRNTFSRYMHTFSGDKTDSRYATQRRVSDVTRYFLAAYRTAKTLSSVNSRCSQYRYLTSNNKYIAGRYSFDNIIIFWFFLKGLFLETQQNFTTRTDCSVTFSSHNCSLRLSKVHNYCEGVQMRTSVAARRCWVICQWCGLLDESLTCRSSVHPPVTPAAAAADADAVTVTAESYWRN